MAKSKFLTFDLGTTLYKVALFDDAGNLLALERAVPAIGRPNPGLVTIDPADFMATLIDAALKLKSEAKDAWSDIAAISFATQANSFMLVNREGPKTPLILWPDQRAQELAGELAKIAAMPRFREITGLPRVSSLLAASKVLWLRRNQSAEIEGARQLLFISDFFTAEFAGGEMTEAGVAGLSGLFDLGAMKWREDLLRAFEIVPMVMPEVSRAGTPLGPVSAKIAQQLELSADCWFVVGALDQYAGAIGTGTIIPGRICETTGTVLAAVRCSDELRTDLPPDVFQGPGFDGDRFFQMSFSSTSANLLEWYRNQLPAKPSFDELTRAAESAPPSDLVIELYDDRGPIEAVFRHVRAEHTPGQVVRAIMQRVAHSLKQQVEHLAQGDRLTVIRSAGGAARNDFWLQMKANVLGVPFEATECEEPTSLGAAMLAARAIGYGELPDIAKKWVKVRKRFTPQS